MAQVTTGFRSMLSSPSVDDLFQSILGASRARQEIVANYVRPYHGMKILDIGCGTGEILDHMPNIEYLDIDLSESYIRSAINRFGDRAEFRVGRAEAASLQMGRRFDVILSLGVIHHLEDDQVNAILDAVKSVLEIGGRIVTGDPCFDDEQSPIARWLASRDRGQNVRTERQYRAFFEKRFGSVKSHVRHDLLRIPYTHCIIRDGIAVRRGQQLHFRCRLDCRQASKKRRNECIAIDDRDQRRVISYSRRGGSRLEFILGSVDCEQAHAFRHRRVHLPQPSELVVYSPPLGVNYGERTVAVVTMRTMSAVLNRSLACLVVEIAARNSIATSIRRRRSMPKERQSIDGTKLIAELHRLREISVRQIVLSSLLEKHK